MQGRRNYLIELLVDCMQVLALISVKIIYLKEKANMNQAGNFILIKLAIIRKTRINLSFYNKSEYFAFIILNLAKGW